MDGIELAQKFIGWLTSRPEGRGLWKAFCEETGVDAKSLLKPKGYRCIRGFKPTRGGWYYKDQIITEEKYNSLRIVDQVGHWQKIDRDNNNCETTKSAALLWQ